ncbi:MAG: antibiotic ABC transporter permease [Zetaproteobacteria bacterium CG06_land_8_20_14_3_00_59_53]|nr:MAG: antibiotic ABC transporter permease [Zetaproteobacteria bacterium CG2_30_59_37]PIO89711.1 MAG: antibiotic ABC transporter permease [Zetaproteobacteria bacterium CG23_combo_of_CG06-09_8_20_14_all_59_86]PIQ65121.1 MAG: antibiotic ABC transporter permease [Zetaproteobacteria bacterium CG11_big_fil_rev_8_21_14_0_20_59_439]PIU70123.1 MAG: antibiotic ABC transporter permease [Zetaproteobacteria bacterium CG06_land_8_20_14_3_00_59_53]PIU97628.1 MAG: antibiotic ABC transporter permease [Zetapro
MVASLRRVIALMGKEFLALLKDKKGRFVLIGPPIIQLMVFGYAASFDLNHVPYAIYNEDGGSASRQLVARFEGAPPFDAATIVHDDAQIQPLIDDKQVLLVVHIGPQFSRQLALGESAHVQLIVDGRNSNTALIILGYASSIVQSFNTGRLVTSGSSGPPAHISMRAWFNPNLQSRWFLIPGIAGLITLVVTMMVVSLSVAREREQGTFDQLMVTPLRPFEILLGKALPGFIIGMLESTLVILIAVFWFNIPLLSSPLVLYSGIALFLLSAIGIGLMISSLSLTQQQGFLGAFLFIVPSILLSGFATPIENMPHAVQMITLIDPMRYFMIILRGVFLEGAGFSILLPQFWPLAVIGFVCMSLATWLFRHRMV